MTGSGVGRSNIGACYNLRKATTIKKKGWANWGRLEGPKITSKKFLMSAHHMGEPPCPEREETYILRISTCRHGG